MHSQVVPEAVSAGAFVQLGAPDPRIESAAILDDTRLLFGTVLMFRWLSVQIDKLVVPLLLPAGIGHVSLSRAQAFA
jgi:hypothetical protein